MNRILLFISLLVFISWACEKVEPVLDNPMDPDNPNYQVPTVTITSGPADGEIVDTSAITFVWEGNEQNMTFRTKFDSSKWSEWYTITVQSFEYLDEGSHSFSVQSQYINGDTSEVMQINFIVDAIQGPALMFYPRRNIASKGDTVIFQILAEEVENLTAAEFSVSFDPVLGRVELIDQGSIFMGTGESIFHNVFDNSQGTFSVLTALLGGNESSISGTGVLAILKIIVLKRNDVILSFDSTKVLRGPENQNISIAETVNGYIDVR